MYNTKLIKEGTTLFPEMIDCSNMYYENKPYAYWLESGNVAEWVLYKEYNDYKSICHPNDCLKGISKEELIRSFMTYSFYENDDRAKLCKSFRQRSLTDDSYTFDDFIDE